MAPQDVNVLILGESGVGKELVARRLYHHSQRADRPFLAINCAAMPETLLESELFGHEQGRSPGQTGGGSASSSSATAARSSSTRSATCRRPLQAKILRVLQEQRFERVGGNETVQTQVRVLAATNQDLEQRIAEGRFRKDLYYRLQRGDASRCRRCASAAEDVAELAHYFLFLFNRELGTGLSGLRPGSAGAACRATPGRATSASCKGVLKEAMLRGAGPLLMPQVLPPQLRAPALPSRRPRRARGEPAGLDVRAR